MSRMPEELHEVWKSVNEVEVPLSVILLSRNYCSVIPFNVVTLQFKFVFLEFKSPAIIVASSVRRRILGFDVSFVSSQPEVEMR